jgi:predicted CxxxxCH...CXXCH cytochrome family protein
MMHTTIRILVPLSTVATALLLAASCSRTAPHVGPGAWTLEGAHAATACESCHKTGFTERPTRCSACHEDDRPQSHIDDPERADAECAACHTPFAWKLGSDDTGLQVDACTGCHGSPETGPGPLAPGQDIPDNDPVGGNVVDPIGAHEAHVRGDDGDYAAVPCSECHPEYTSVEDVGHLDQPGQEDPAEVVFGDLASEGTAFYDPATGTCSGTYCHGDSATLADAEAAAPTPTWAGGTGCGDCHGLPSLTSHEPDQTTCDDCHVPISPETHVNGGLNMSFR